MKKEYSVEEARNKAEAYCSVAERCPMEVATKLTQWGVSAESVDEIIGQLIKEKFIDSLRYAKAFTRDKYRFNQWGRVKIAQALRMKQIASTEIRLALEEIDEEEYRSILRSLMAKKLKTIKTANDYERSGKLIRFAVGHGYEMESILDCMKQLGCEDESFD